MLPTASSRELLRMVEALGLSGSWSWTFDTNEQIWSDGLRAILGLRPETAADFGLLYRLIHPDDRPRVLRPDEVAQVGVATEQTFRIIRPDGTKRTVSSRGETFFSTEGRPLRAMGVLVDVSDRAVVARAQTALRRRKRAIFERLGAFTSTTTVYPYTNFSEEWVELVGVPKAELLEDPTLPVVEEERRRWRDQAHEQYMSGAMVHAQPRLLLANREIVQYRTIALPMFDAAGGVSGWSNFVAPLQLRSWVPIDLVVALEERIRGFHIRAGRALLGWSMGDLAAASGLSLSTIRRLEDDLEARTSRSAKASVDALRRHGVHFSLADDASIVLGKG